MVLRTTPVLVLLITNRFETWFTIVFTLQCHQRRGAGFSSPSTMTLNLDIANVRFRVARENLKCYPPAIKHGNENPANSIFFRQKCMFFPGECTMFSNEFPISIIISHVFFSGRLMSFIQDLVLFHHVSPCFTISRST